jgi:regulator of nucleoside diphosphate kinase
MGLALFGYAQGDKVEWEFPTGKNAIDIIKVEQMVREMKMQK